ncbi:MAG: cupin domain-containing protein [Gemmatimonadota bacterium]
MSSESEGAPDGGESTDRIGGREPRIVDKPWGREVWYAHNDRYAGKILEVEEGHQLSLQKHRVKHETLYLQSGRVRMQLGDEEFEWTPGERVEIAPETVHRMESLGDSVMLEVSSPELDDVVRLEDRYGRS